MKFLIFFILLIQISSEEIKKNISKISFGSCLEQWNPQKFWIPLQKEKPDVFIWLGDNIYFDSYIASEKKFYYNLLTEKKEYKDLKKITRMLYTWDDHDFGVNDSGADYIDKINSQKLFLESFEEKKDSPRWKREGIYDSYYFGSKGNFVQIILLDTRYFRSDLKRSNLKYFGIKKNLKDYDENSTMLGKMQWDWFEKELDVEADLRIIISSVQLINDSHFFEKWGNFPKEREKFFDLIQKKKSKRVILLSGDRHLSELSKYKENLLYPIYELTSSSLNKPFKNVKPEQNPFRIYQPVIEENFGQVIIDWKEKFLNFEIIDSDGKKRLTQKVLFSEIE